MRIAIVGAGGVGGYCGGVLARSGHVVHVLARGQNLAAVRRRGLEVRTPDDSFVVHVRADDDVQQFEPVDFAIIAVKTYSLAEIAPAAQHLADRGALILPLLNGIDITDRLVQMGVPKQNALGGLTTISAQRTAPGTFECHAKVQQIVLGEIDAVEPTETDARTRAEGVQQIAEALRSAGIETQISTDIRAALWRKFAFIAPVAAACGLARSSIGPIRATPLGRLLLERGIREVIAVGRAHGICLAEEEEVRRILEFCDSLPETNKPSLLRDLEEGRRTEIEDLSGAVSRMGRLLGIETPIHDTAAAAIRVSTASILHGSSE